LQQSWCTITQESNKSKQKPVIEIKTLFNQLIKILQHNCWIGYNTQIELDTADNNNNNDRLTAFDPGQPG